MGWAKRADGSLVGDEPTEAVANTLSRLGEESRRRTRAEPSGEMLLEGFVAALALDGADAPFYAEPQRIDQLIVPRAKREVRIDGRHAEPWVTAQWYELLDTVADQYVEARERPPQLRELVHYLADVPVLAAEGWRMQDADIVLATRKKPRERKSAPKVPPPPATDGPRVRHPKFGEGIVVAEADDRLTIDFAGERRVLLRSFVTPV